MAQISRTGRDCSVLLSCYRTNQHGRIANKISTQRTAASLKPRVSWSSVRSIVKTKKQKLPGISGLENQLKLRWGGLYLHGYGEVVLRLRWEENINGFFLEGRVTGRRGSDLDDVKFPSCSSSHSETEQGGLLLISLHLELTEGSRVALNGLGDVPLHAVELHGPDHPVVLGADTDKKEPGVVLVSAVVDYLKREVG